MKENSVLIAEYDKIEEGNLLAIIDFFQSNYDSLFSSGLTELAKIEHIYIDYFVSLHDKSRYSKILEVIDKMEQLDVFKLYRKTDTEFDEQVRFYKYSSLFSKKRYADSKRGFAELLRDYPENEDYQDWFSDSKNRIRIKTFALLMYLTGGFMFIVLILRLYLHLPILVQISRIAEGLFIISVVLYFTRFIKKH